MPKIILVRHGQAAASWGTDPDPGLSELGQQQARHAAETLARYRHCQVQSSPKARAQETAALATESWGQTITINPSVIEVPSGSRPLEQRGEWLKQVFQQSWGEQDEEVSRWREGIVQSLLSQKEDCVMFCHFVVINAAVGAARNSERVMQCRPDYCSQWVFNTDSGQLELIAGGPEDESLVL